MFKNAWPLAVALLAGVAALMMARAASFVPPAEEGVAQTRLALDAQAMAGRLARAVQFATVSPQPPEPFDPRPFEDFVAWLASAYPEAHRVLKLEIVGGHTLFYTWQGTDAAARPALLAGHYDVVPVPSGTVAAWTHPPFSGAVEGGYVWGRGTLDDKSAVVAIMEAVEHLARQGHKPRATLHLSFGHDEELGGDGGAAAVVKLLKSRGVRPAWSLDEGSFVLSGVIPGVAHPVASINVAEKGYVTLLLTARGVGGHSSMPPRQTAVGVLARAVVALEEHPMPGGLDGFGGLTMDALARHMPFDKRVLFSNRWLFGPLIERALAASPSSDAMIRTTTAPTMLSGGAKENVLPTEATATVNFRLHPRDTPEAVEAHARRVVADERVSIAMTRGYGASAVASTDSAAYRALRHAMRSAYGDVATVPGITVGGTDSKHYQEVVDNAYRFNPMMIGAEDLTGFHGINERLSVANLERAVRFYVELIRGEAR